MMTRGPSSISTRPQILVDTNVLLRLSNLGLPASSKETADGTALENAIFSRQYRMCITFQNLTEYWSVAGRSVEANGLALSRQQINNQIEQFRKTFRLLPDQATALDIWLELCNKYQVSGKHVHDIRLAAVALSNGVNKIMTLNNRDFEQLEELSIINPMEPNQKVEN